MPSRRALLAAAEAFCKSFSEKEPLDTIMSHFAQGTDAPSEDLLVWEHGLRNLVPGHFIGEKWRGASGARAYFEKIAEFLSYENMSFRDYIVDAEEKKVAVTGEAKFTWKTTNESWDEVFQYVLVFHDNANLVEYHVWADTLAAFLSSKGELKKEVEQAAKD